MVLLKQEDDTLSNVKIDLTHENDNPFKMFLMLEHHYSVMHLGLHNFPGYNELLLFMHA